ncbi:hypothetical protein AB0D27_07445 [Streptomyces sp. NPDC048415]|uniref:hypothetical protein n=1 Tax=Streptomyces sp. NPDC048415 TaxID=3154822 RepID=UPI00343E9517
MDVFALFPESPAVGEGVIDGVAERQVLARPRHQHAALSDGRRSTIGCRPYSSLLESALHGVLSAADFVAADIGGESDSRGEDDSAGSRAHTAVAAVHNPAATVAVATMATWVMPHLK